MTTKPKAKPKAAAPKSPPTTPPADPVELPTTAPPADPDIIVKVRAEIQARIAELAPLAEEHARLILAEKALSGEVQPVNRGGRPRTRI